MMYAYANINKENIFPLIRTNAENSFQKSIEQMNNFVKEPKAGFGVFLGSSVVEIFHMTNANASAKKTMRPHFSHLDFPVGSKRTTAVTVNDTRSIFVDRKKNDHTHSD